MKEIKPMTLLLIEDDVRDCLIFKDYINKREDVKLIGITDSSDEGIKLVQTHLPEAVILDLQLTRGSGSGIQFLKDLKAKQLAFRPIIIVTSSNQSEIVKDYIEDLGIDFYFCKRQRNYSVDLVINTLLPLRNHLRFCEDNDEKFNRAMIESPEELKYRIHERIDTELDLIGIRAKYKGRNYLREGIYLQIEERIEGGSVIERVAAKNRHAYNSISTVMQTAINDAWKNANPKELEVHYTARISPKTGTPTPSDFIHYYARKIQKTL